MKTSPNLTPWASQDKISVLYIYYDVHCKVMICCCYRDRPAAIPVEVKSIDDTSNFDDFPDIDLKWRK